MKTRKARTVARPAIIRVGSAYVTVHVGGKVSKTETQDDYDQPMDGNFNYPQIPVIEGGVAYEFCISQFAEAFGQQYRRLGIYPVVITVEAQYLGQ